MGNTTGRVQHPDSKAGEAMQTTVQRTQPGIAFSPLQRSPLTYSPQVPTAPMPQGQLSQLKNDGMALPRGGQGWCSTMGVPISFTWSHGGESVSLEGSFDNWTTCTPLHKSGKDFTVIKLLTPGIYQYKFIVDGHWRYAEEQPAAYDEVGNVNNVVEVHEFIPENLDSVAGFDQPASPPSSYTCQDFMPEDFAKEPPSVPPHLQLTLLNVPPVVQAMPAALPRPAHVVLNHVYTDKVSSSGDTLVLGMTHRFRSKYITQLHYKTRKPKETV